MMNPRDMLQMNPRDMLNTHVSQSIAYMGLALAATCYGAWHILANVAMSRGSPSIIFALYRSAGGLACCLLALKLCPELGDKTRKEKGKTIFGDSIQSLHQERNGYSAKDQLMFIILGLCQAGNICGFIIANTMLPALTCSIFAPLVPVVTAIISIAWGLEERDQTKLIGLCTAVLGAIIVILFEGEHVAKAPAVPLTTITAMTTAMAHPTGTVAKAVVNATGVTVANATKVLAANATAAAHASTVAVTSASAVPHFTAAVDAVVDTVSTTVAPTVSGNWKWCGYFFLVMSTFCAAMYFVTMKSVLQNYSPVRATAMAYSHATAFIFLAAFFRHGLDPFAWFLYGDFVSWLCLIYAACITTGLTYSIQAWAVGQTTPSTVTAFSTLSPVAATMISIAFLNVPLMTYQLVGGALIIGGLWINITVQAGEEKCMEKVALKQPNEYGMFSTRSPYDSL